MHLLMHFLVPNGFKSNSVPGDWCKLLFIEFKKWKNRNVVFASDLFFL